MSRDENLEQSSDGYLYYYHSKYPLDIDYEVTEGNIKVTVTEYFKGHINYTMTKRSTVLEKMTTEQIEDYILDIVDSFIKKYKK